MRLAQKHVIVEGSVINDMEEGNHVKLIVGDAPSVIFNLSLEQARSLAISLVEQVHRLEVANSMRRTELSYTRLAQSNVKTSGVKRMVLNARPTA